MYILLYYYLSKRKMSLAGYSNFIIKYKSFSIVSAIIAVITLGSGWCLDKHKQPSFQIHFMTFSSEKVQTETDHCWFIII